ncbi:microviridin/marinostatin family tricyclic proteinase inhibitor [Chryseobacterium sp. MMS23-Vi53]|uniref:microviridin/marinostatin family tricyclic proteinase inhibitor n=1 Tax=Chryseobacterium sp. MMS23-Vi53 TaxID=3386644 RepID=UPI0039EC6363
MENKNSKKPFFASFLEKQVQDPEKVKGGSGSITTALEDAVTDALKDGVTSTLFDAPTKPQNDQAQTMKYPSDGDENGDAI